MKINKGNLWIVLEKYDSKDYDPLCNGLSRIIQGNSTSGDLLDIFTFLEKIQKEDRDIIEKEIGNNITNVLFCI
jgi:hypothetical protein